MRIRFYHVILTILFFGLSLSSSISDPEDETATIEILATTDMHAWLYGHAHGLTNDTYIFDAGISHVASLRNRRASAAAAAGKGFMMFDSGDQVQGTGLSDGAPVPGRNIWEVLAPLGWTGMTIGNHDLNDVAAVEWFRAEGRHLFKGAYLTGNVQWTEAVEAGDTSTEKYYSGAACRVHTDEVTGLRVLVTGVIYNFNMAPSLVKITSPDKWLKSADAKHAIAQCIGDTPVDFAVLLIHQALTTVKLSADYDAGYIASIRAHNDTLLPAEQRGVDLPLLILAGHNHTWDQSQCFTKSTNCYIMENDSYLWQIGNFDLKFRRNATTTHGRWFFAEHPNHNIETTPLSAGVRVGQKYLAEYQHIEDYDELLDEQGLAIQADIEQRRHALDLDAVVGCVPAYYGAQSWAGIAESLPRLWMDLILPRSIPLFDHKRGSQRVWAANVLNFRDALVEGPLTLDAAYMIFPFSEEWNIIRGLTGEQLYYAVFTTQKIDQTPGKWSGSSPHYVISERFDRIQPTGVYDLVAPNYDARRFARNLNSHYKGQKFVLEDFVGRFGEKSANDAFRGFLRSCFECVPANKLYKADNGIDKISCIEKPADTDNTKSVTTSVLFGLDLLLLTIICVIGGVYAIHQYKKRRSEENRALLDDC